MKVEVREEKVIIEGYVNAVERNSKPLWSAIGKFIERICAGTFKKAIKRNNDIKVLLNHDWNRILGSTSDNTLELREDNIGLHAKATISDVEVMKKARNGDLVGWSFGFTDREIENSVEKGMPLREVKDLDLYEVSILDRTKSPAYDGTLIEARDEGQPVQFRAEIEEIEPIKEEIKEEVQENDVVGDEESQEPQQEEVVEEQQNEVQPVQQEIVDENIAKEIDYSVFEAEILKMKGE